MNRITLSCVVLLSALTGCAGHENPEKMVDAAKTIDQRFMQSLSSGDVDAVMENYWNNPDLVVYPPDFLEVHGWAAVKDGIGHFLKSTPGVKMELVTSNYIPAGDMVIGYGTFKMITPTAEGKSNETMGRYTEVFAKRDGKWVVIVDHPSFPIPGEK